MLLAAFEPGREMAIANFFLAIFCLFTFALPLLLITRGDKTKANGDILLATVNPWYKVVKEAESAQVVVTEITPSIKMEPNLDLIPDHETIVGLGDCISLEIEAHERLEDSSFQSQQIDDELLAA